MIGLARGGAADLLHQAQCPGHLVTGDVASALLDQAVQRHLVAGPGFDDGGHRLAEPAGDGALDCPEPWAVTALEEALGIYARQTKAAVVLLKDFPAKYRTALGRFISGGYRRAPSMPACSLDLDFASFEEFMSARLGRKLRYKYIKLNKRPPISQLRRGTIL